MLSRLFKRSAVLSLTLPFLGLGAIAPPTSAADEAAALLAKHKAFVGWEFGDGTFTTMRVEGTTTKLGKDKKLKKIATYVDLRRGIVHRQISNDLESGGQSFYGFTGSRFWYSDANGFTVPIVSERSKVALARAVIFNEATTTYAATARGSDTVNGKRVVVLREKMPSGTLIDLYVDPDTGAYLRAVIAPDDNILSKKIDIEGYEAALPGKRLISSWHYSDSQNRYNEKIEPNAPISDDDLRPPPQRASWTFAVPQSFPIEFTDKRIFVLARVNGHEGRFIFDSGASKSIYFTPEFTKRAGLKALPGVLIVGSLEGENRAHYVAVDSIKFADGSELKDVIATGDTDISFASHERFDGLIGYAFLAAAIVDIDLDASRMTIYDPKVSAPDESQGMVFVADLTEGIPTVPIKVNGSTTLQAYLDTGNPLWTLLPATLIGKLRVLIDKDNPAFAAFTGGRTDYIRCGALTSMQFGPISYDAPPFCFSDAIESGTALVSLDFLKNFNMVFDYPDSKIIMVPRKNISK